MGAVETLEQTLQDLHEAGKRVEFSWLWDGGVDVKAGEEERNFPSVAEVLPWLQHWYGLTPSGTISDALETELQKMYDSEINVTVRTGGTGIFVALGNDFTGFDMEGEVSKTGDVLSWLQRAIHERFPMSKYDVERLGGTFTPQMAQIGDNAELDLTCPKCGSTMDLIAADEPGSFLPVCPVCATLAWNKEDGRAETREPEEITGEAKRKLLEDGRFITVDEELDKLRRSNKTGPLQ
jgi:rubrerythrin